MTANAGTLATVANYLGQALQPLQANLSANGIIPLFANLGLQFPPALTSQPAFMHSVNAGATAVAALSPTLSKLASDVSAGNDASIVTDALQLLDEIGTIITSLDQIATDLQSAGPSLPGITSSELSAFAGALTQNLLSYLVISFLEDLQPGAVGLANLVGIVDDLPNPGVPGDPTHPPFTTRKLNLSNLAALFTSPASLLQTLVGWGSPSFNGGSLMPRLASSLDLLGLFARIKPGSPQGIDTSLISLQVNPASSPPGLLATLNYPIPDGLNVTLPLSPLWSLQVQTEGPLAANLGVTITPLANIAFAPPSGTLNGAFQMNLVAPPPGSTDPLILLGQTGGSYVSASSFTVGAGLGFAWNAAAGSATVTPSIQFGVAGGVVFIDMSEADGFLSDVTSGTPIRGTFDLTATWQPTVGLHIQGGAQLEIDLPLHLDLGPVTLPTLYLIGGADTTGITLEVSAALGVTLGPIAASVDRVGLLSTLSFPSHGGNLGFANLALGFKPPNGLGLSIDAGVIAGGGYISFDPSQGQYSGVISLTLLDTIGITVITVLDTKMPDGSSGFALLFIITFTLPPIQLGFGFTLTGVGGLGGVNRSMSTSALQAAFMAHTLDLIMFPPDPIANAPQIISDIRNIFPPADGRYLFGPLLQFGWGTPTLISMSIGAILSVPDPIVLALIGLVDAGLPTEDLALIELHIEVLGIIDFGTKTLSIEGTLYDSRVLIFSMGGSLAFELAWGDDPNFVFSLGGFNPSFNTAGLNIPPMARCSVSIGDGDNPRISANNYYAITSNSYQFGANVQAYASAAGFTISGYLGFDVLIIISPFSFEFDFQAGFSVSFLGLSLIGLNVDGLFSGPTPWHFHGDASISLLFFTVSASLDITWGSSTQATIPAKPVLPDLFAALDNPANWSAALPSGATAGASFVTLKPTDTTLRVHPMGTLTVREHVVPLDVPITQYGNATPSDGTEFTIQSVQINTQTETLQSIKDYFAIGQFETLSDADKLSKPSFEDYDAGVTIGSEAVVSGQDRPCTVTYHEYYIDSPTSFSRFTGLYQMPSAIHEALSAQSAGYNSPLKNSGLTKYSAGPQPAAITIEEPPYVVTNVVDLSVRSDISAGDGTTYYQAQAAVQSYLDANPNETGTLQIMPLYELAA
jgi:hypothetical protein